MARFIPTEKGNPGSNLPLHLRGWREDVYTRLRAFRDSGSSIQEERKELARAGNRGRFGPSLPGNYRLDRGEKTQRFPVLAE